MALVSNIDKQFHNQELWLNFLSKRFNKVTKSSPVEIVVQLQNLYQHLNAQVYWKDASSIYRWCNQQQLKRIGLQHIDEFIGKTIFQLANEKSAYAIQNCDQKIMNAPTERLITEEAYMTNGIYIKTLSLKSSVYTPGGNLLGMFGISVPVFQNRYQLLYCNLIAAGLSSQQANCLIKVVYGYSASQIANQLNISKRTVESYLEIVKNKFSAFTKQELIEIVLQNYFY